MKLKTATETRVDHEDVDDVIGIAAQMKEAEADQLSVEDLQGVAAELDIEPEYVERAVKTLEERRAKAEAEVREVTRKKRLVLGGAVAVASLLLVVFCATALSASATLGELHGAVAQKHAQVANVIERQQSVESKLKGLPMTPDREAEIIGSENRVRVEKKRYDEAATAYNTFAVTWRGKLGATLSSTPDHVPLSHEVRSW